MVNLCLRAVVAVVDSTGHVTREGAFTKVKKIGAGVVCQPSKFNQPIPIAVSIVYSYSFLYSWELRGGAAAQSARPAFVRQASKQRLSIFVLSAPGWVPWAMRHTYKQWDSGDDKMKSRSSSDPERLSREVANGIFSSWEIKDEHIWECQCQR